MFSFSKLIILTATALLLFNGNEATSTSAPSTNNLADNLRYIGPHNIRDTYMHIKFLQKASSLSVMDAVKSTYQIKPIVRDLNYVADDQEMFEILIKREIAWNYPDFNEFGLFPCEQLKLNPPYGFSKYLELNTDGYKVSIQKFTKASDYFTAAEKAKELQTKCLIKSLEKGGGNFMCPVDQIPFCFSDTWQQIWWKVTE